MGKIILLLVLLFSYGCVKKQIKKNNSVSESVEKKIDTTEKMSSTNSLDGFDVGDYNTNPGYNGQVRDSVRNAEPKMGYDGFNKFLKKNLRYPETAKENKKEGTVIIDAMVDAKGEIFVIGIWGFGYGSEEEAKRLVKAAGKWRPALDLKKNKTLATSVLIEVEFELDK